MDTPTPAEQAAFTSKIEVVQQFIASIDPTMTFRVPILVSLLGKIIIQNTVYALWNTFLKDDFKENGRDEDQFNLLFHSFDRAEELPGDFGAILKLMVTGKIDGIIPANKPVNFFPAGFWQMPEVQRELTTQSMECIASLIENVCDLHFELPPDWEEKEHPEGLYVSPTEQAERLTLSLIERVGEVQMANAVEGSEKLAPSEEVKDETEESQPSGENATDDSQVPPDGDAGEKDETTE